MGDLIVEELRKELNLREKIVLKIFRKYTYKVYKIGITYGFNNK